MAKENGSNPTASGNTESFRTRKVWLYMVDGRNTRDLAILDSQGFDRWRGNPLTRAGDLIVMYRSAPFSDIAYIFMAASNAWRTAVTSRWPWKYAVEIADGFRLQRVIKLRELRANPALRHWDFLWHQRGATSRRSDLQEQGVWPALQRVLENHAPGLRTHFRGAWTGRGRRQIVFLSYASDDRRKVQHLYEAFSRNGIDVWLDRHELQPAEDWDRKIRQTVRSCKAFVACISRTWLQRDKNSYAKKEFSMALEEQSRRRKRYLFPVLIEDCPVLPILPVQATALTGPKRTVKINRFALTLRSVLSSQQQK